MKPRIASPPRIALALAGGGPLGAIYEIGALCALEEALPGLDLNRLDHYVGVSAGGFIAASLANGITPQALRAAFIEDDHSSLDAFDPALLMQPAWAEFARRSTMLPGLLNAVAFGWLLGGHSLINILEQLGAGLPTGVFSSAAVGARLAALFSVHGRSNDFRQLKTRLTLVATNLDSGATAPFGRPGWEHVPISTAVQASSALPGLFPPIKIDGQYYVDGALKKTMHASVALDEGVDLMLCLNPLVPFDATPHLLSAAARHSHKRIPHIVEGGLPAVLSQTFRTLIHSRLELGMKQYERAYPQTDIVLIEPDHHDPELYLANTFSYSQRRHLAEHAYQQTRCLLRSRSSGLAQTLARHGIGIDRSALYDPTRRLLGASPTHRVGHALRTLAEALQRLEQFVGQPPAVAVQG